MKTWPCILLVLIAASATAQQQNVHAGKGGVLYKEKKFDAALSEYKQAAELNAKDPVIRYNLGNAYFRNEKYEEAIKEFDVPTEEKNEHSLRQRSFYNKGVALSRQNKLEESIDAYKNAVLLNPNDEDARINLQKALLELKKKQQPKEEKKRKR